MLLNHHPRKITHFYRKKTYIGPKRPKNWPSGAIKNTYVNVKFAAENDFGGKNRVSHLINLTWDSQGPKL